jgi:chromosome partitioning protein
MKTIAVASAKGGSGKSSLTAALAVRACQDTPKVAMMDLDAGQASLRQWWTVRGSPDVPGLAVNVSNVPRDVKTLATGYEWLFIDTPPAEMDLIEQAIAVADAVLVPVRCGFFDVLAVQTVCEMCRGHRKPFAFVMAAVDVRFKSLRTQTFAALADFGPVLKTHVSYRQPWIAALVIGKTGPEIEKDLRPELDSLWVEVKALATEGGVK